MSFAGVHLPVVLDDTALLLDHMEGRGGKR